MLGTGGAFGAGGLGAGGGVGGGGGLGGSGGGFGGGGGEGYGSFPGGGGGFGGGGGGVAGGGAAGGAPGFGGGTANAANGGGGAGMGGAVFNMQGELEIRNSTLAANAAHGGADNVSDHGKGIAGAVFNLNGVFTAVGSTFAGNSAAYFAAQIYNLEYDGYDTRAATTTLRDTIVANGVGSAEWPYDLTSTKSTYGIVPPAASAASADISQFDLVRASHVQELGTISGAPLSADPQLGPLQSNGGPTQTMALEVGSPAIDAGSAFGLDADQRGELRPSDFPALANASDGSDIGAFEVQSPTPPPADTTPPSFLGPVRATPPVFAVGRRRKPVRAATASKVGKVRRGTTFRYSLSEPAHVAFSIERKQRSRHKKVGELVQRAAGGRNAMPFSGRVRHKALVPGRYRATLVATDAAGNRSQARRVAFRIVK